MGPRRLALRWRRWTPFLVGAAAGLALALTFLVGRAGRERMAVRPLAPEAESAAWTEDGLRRGVPFETFPDPPGEGPVTTAHYWVSLPAYDLELRRRGDRLTLLTRGTDVQVNGGAWIAFGEGRVLGGRPEGFAGLEARISWSCIGLRFRSASDGVARMTFSADGHTFVVDYLQGQESLLVGGPDTYVRARGRLARGPRPAYGALHGQVPITARLARHEAEARVRVAGRVVGVDGEGVPDALVQLKGVPRTRVHADAEGRFRFEFRGGEAPWSQSIAAGAVGYRNGEVVLFTGDATEDLRLELTPLALSDDPNYAWIHPAPDRDPDDAAACGTCHSWQYTEWLGSRHARSADNGRVFWERERMRRKAPDAPDDCAGCHQPGVASVSGAVPLVPRGILAGNHCDLCHKIRHVGEVGRPGVLGAITLARPDPTRPERPGPIGQVFGANPDVTFAYMGAAWSPLHATSWLCAGCHQGGGVPGRAKIDTFAEWRAWAATRENEEFRSCQDCHMKGATTQREDGAPIDQLAWDSLHRRPGAVHSHAFPGTGAAFVRDALEVEVEKRWEAATGTWDVLVRFRSRDVGHKLPTGTWTKQVALGLWARRGDRWFEPLGGERALLGAGPAPAGPLVGGDWRDPPGTILGVFAKGRDDVVADFWEPPAEGEVVDRRLAPGEVRELRARFRDPEPGGAEPVVELRALHRRGPIGAGPAETPWPTRPNDPPPQVEWWRIER